MMDSVFRFSYSSVAFVLILVGLIAAGCDTEGTSIYDPDTNTGPDPQISGIEPASRSLAGVGTITINGSNFSAVPVDNLVFFGQTRATVVEASPTRLVVEAPNLPDQDVTVRVAVVGAENFSNSIAYRLDAAVSEFGDVRGFETPFALTADDAGNIYVSMFATGASIGIQQIAPDGTRSEFVSTTFPWDAIELGTDGRLYGVRNQRAVFRFDPGGAQQNWAIIEDRAARFLAITFDDAGNAYVGGAGGNLYRIAPVDAPTAADIAAVPFDGEIDGLTVVNGAVYAAATMGEVSGVWRFPITPDGLGAAEMVFDVASVAPAGTRTLSIAAASNGDLFVGTDADDPLLLVHPDGSGEVYFPGLLPSPIVSLAFGTGTDLFASQSTGNSGTILRINSLREGA